MAEKSKELINSAIKKTKETHRFNRNAATEANIGMIASITHNRNPPAKQIGVIHNTRRLVNGARTEILPK